ncbi:hypothetical protein LZ30DRAFT_138878 [Colletotrichum cereale]|nr:hypothetical protein LZ30DRAFT_138878 [Colletotrichum cereale]
MAWHLCVRTELRRNMLFSPTPPVLPNHIITDQYLNQFPSARVCCRAPSVMQLNPIWQRGDNASCTETDAILPLLHCSAYQSCKIVETSRKHCHKGNPCSIKAHPKRQQSVAARTWNSSIPKWYNGVQCDEDKTLFLQHRPPVVSHVQHPRIVHEYITEPSLSSDHRHFDND